MARVKISVTREIIEIGDRHSFSTCPVALAIRARLGLPSHYSCAVSTRYFCTDNYRKQLPEEVTNKIILFDDTGKMTPFEFEIDLP